RDAVAALLTARARAVPPADPYLRSEQALLIGHAHHPAPKARGGGPAAAWLPYAPEAHARFPLTLLGLRADAVVEEGDTGALDALGEAPPGYRLLPAHPWQLALVADALAPAFADGRLIRLGESAAPAWPTAAIRTVHVPEADL
ncbi:IucA/IucC family protein, partial [Streptomyces sp. TRM76130]|nr:IucA/IucC family protein [Streptomyces sp. TRM76130]